MRLVIKRRVCISQGDLSVTLKVVVQSKFYKVSPLVNYNI